MLIGDVRSGLIEARHEVSIAAVSADGRVLFAEGPQVDVPFFFRSAAKPFQAAESQASGAGLCPEELAIATGSHGGQPTHVAYVRKILGRSGLGEDDLLCPPSWPSSLSAMRTWVALGERSPRRLFYNCSGKHSGMLAACVANDWPLTYIDPDHPLQQRIGLRMADATGEDPGQTGIDGCGVPTFSGSVIGLARAFARVASDPEYREVREAMSRFASLTSDGDRSEAKLARWVPSVVKGGAQGCLGLAWYGGIGIVAKSSSGLLAPAAVGIVDGLRRLGLLPDHPTAMLADVAAPPVLGGGREVGRQHVVGR
ncbi:asparaginase [bacterium]|nr:asparaginase [bacterium]